MGGETRAASVSMQRLGGSVKSATGAFSKFTKSIGRIAFYRSIRTAIRYVTDGFKKGLEAAYNWSKLNPEHAKLAGAMDKLRESAGKMKLQLGAAFGGFLDVRDDLISRCGPRPSRSFHAPSKTHTRRANFKSHIDSFL